VGKIWYVENNFSTTRTDEEADHLYRVGKGEIRVIIRLAMSNHSK
jgi:hypothetical protein